MRNIKKLNLKLKEIESTTKNPKQISNMSLFDFIIYKHNISKKKKIKTKLKKLILYAKSTIDWYTKYTDRLIDNFKISPVQFNKLEKKAKYKRNITLYKLGLVNKKPIHPYFIPIKKILDLALRPLSKLLLTYKNLCSNIIPQKTNNIAVRAAKLCIRGCQKIKSHYQFFSNNLNSTSSAKYVHNIFEQAKQQLNTESNSSSHIVQTTNQNFASVNYIPYANQASNKKIIRYEFNR